MTKPYNKQEITQLLNKFMTGETTLSEEQALATYFRTHEGDDEWTEYKEMFALFDDGKVDIEQATSADRTDSSFNHHRSSFIIRHSSFAIIGIAATLLIAFLVWPESPKQTTTQTGVLPIVAEANPQPDPQPRVEGKQEEVLPEVQPTPQPAKKRRKAVRKQSAPIEEPVLTEKVDKLTSKQVDKLDVHAEEHVTHYQTIQTVHLSSDVVVYVIEASDVPGASTVPSVSDLRARGLRLTNDVRQASQPTVQF